MESVALGIDGEPNYFFFIAEQGEDKENLP